MDATTSASGAFERAKAAVRKRSSGPGRFLEGLVSASDSGYRAASIGRGTSAMPRFGTAAG
jgi:hypothetical protein